jgi:hypothetical protein
VPVAGVAKVSNLPGAVSTRWVQATERAQRLLIVSEVRHWVSHWEASSGRSRRCGGEGCALCALGGQRQLRMVVLCVDGRGNDILFEFRERHRAVLEGILERCKTTVGVRISVWKDGSAKNSPVCVKYIDQEHAQEREISRLVESFGLPPVMVTVKNGQVSIGELREQTEDECEATALLEDVFNKAAARVRMADAESVGRQGRGEEPPR